jgi:hypothetical protein
MVTNANIMWEDEGVDALYSRCCKDAIYWNTACTKGERDRPTGVLLAHFCEAEIVFGQPPCYLSSVDIFVEVAEEDYVIVDCLPLYELGDQLLKKMVLGERVSPRAVKYCACWSLTVVPADQPELLG